ncbi:hypothetical protein [Salinarchaeum laminariae]|uniref:hypothetical protein n=1 Tax=Salinarchaeum laminariae TaxID=869888 RepID=UPI0020BEA5D5|nr:hypothetical protein [Salinarchaeum laminariae]
MAPPTVEEIDQTDEFVHVRFRDPDAFDEIRTPDWAANVGDSVVEDAEVRMGDESGNADWDVQSVLIPTPVDVDTAEEQAAEIAEKIES